jgi:hypothetical protein
VRRVFRNRDEWRFKTNIWDKGEEELEEEFKRKDT